MYYNSGESLSPASSQEASFQRDSRNGSSLSNEIFLDDSQASAKTTGIEALASVAADSSPLGKDKESQKRRFDALCRKLNVDEQTQSEAWELITRIPSDDNKSEHEEYWFACGLYTAGCSLGEGKNRKGSGVPLSQILKEAKIKIVDFFDPLKIFVSLLSLDDTNLKLLERKYVVTTMLFTKYDKMFGELMQSPSQTDRTNMSIKTRKPDSQLIFSFGWTLFLVAKAKLLSDPSDLVNSLHLLLCCINMQFIHVPSHLRKVSFKDHALVKTGEVNTLLYLCELNSASYSEVLKLHEHLFFPFIQMYQKNGILRCSLPRIPNESSQCKGYLGTLLEGANLQKNFTNITKEYELIYYDTGDIDERLFIDQPDLIGTPSKVGAQTRSYYNMRGKPNGEFMSPSKSHTPVPQSPMTVTMETVSWLKRVVGARDDSPGPILEKFFKACDNNISASIQERVKRMVALIPIPEPENEWAEKPRIDIAVKLYYRILENMLQAEEQRLKHNNFATLLNHDGFHKSLLAACIEVILFAYKMSQLAFPFILQKFDIKPFDFCKLIESVVRHEPELPRAVIRHLNSIEEKILESLGWEESSPVFTLLQDANNRAGVLNLLSNVANNSKPGSIQGLASPMPSRIRNSDMMDNSLNVSGTHLAPPSPNFSGSSPSSPTMSSTDTPTAPRRISSHSLELFFRKVFHLASIRCKNLCVGLQLSTKTYQQIWQTLVHVLTEQSSLIKNRHLDQIVMSSIYGVCKVNQLNRITFRVIIEQYRTQPQCNSKIFREVYLGPGEKSDIIGFYNKFFIPLMEPFLLEFQSQSLNAQEINVAAVSPGRQALSNSGNLSTPGVSLPSQSPHRISATHNLYLSPMRQTRPVTNFPAVNLASSSAVKFSFNFGGSFGESPAKDIQYINDTLNSPKGGRSKPKRLFAAVEDNGQDENAGINSLNSVIPVKRKLGASDEMTDAENFQVPVLTVNQTSAALQTSGEMEAANILYADPGSPTQNTSPATSSPRRDKSPRVRK